MKKRKVVSMLMTALLIGLTATADLAGTAIAAGQTPFASEHKQEKKLKQEVVDFLKGNYGSKSLPDVNEPLELLQAIEKAKGAPMEMEKLEELAARYPDSRTAHTHLAQSYWNKFKQTGDKNFAKKAFRAELKASQNGLAQGGVHYVSWLEEMGTEAGELDAVIDWYHQILAKYPDDYQTNLYLAKVLVKKNDLKKAEELFKKAKEVRPAGNVDAHAAYVEFLLDQGRYEEALTNSILIGEDIYYMHFLQGVALEKLGRGEEAKKHYAKYVDMSKSFPAPKRYMIEGSEYQAGIAFEGMIEPEATGNVNLSWVIACEATTESYGGQSQVGWSVRQRVNRGSTKVNGSTCMYTTNSGSTIDEKYQNVICQPYAYTSLKCNSSKDVYTCVNTNKPSTTTNDVANKVYNGLTPDPYTGYCPTGTKSSTNNCTATCSGATTNKTSYTTNTPHSFLGGSTKPSKPYSCYLEANNVCGNGGSENWFYYNGPNT
jgi:tetratricopeptide (TPR) repeat protein